jgi:4-methylaminobutanoate oxidase (formaldehyde-forming)
LRKKEEGLDMRLVQFRLNDPLPLLYHNEPVIRDGEIVSYITSASYGHSFDAAIGLGYVPCKGETAAQVLASAYEIEIAGERFSAQASLKPMYDPKSERVKA